MKWSATYTPSHPVASTWATRPDSSSQLLDNHGQNEKRMGPTLRDLADRSSRRRCEGYQTEASPRLNHAVLMGRLVYRLAS